VEQIEGQENKIESLSLMIENQYTLWGSLPLPIENMADSYCFLLSSPPPPSCLKFGFGIHKDTNIPQFPPIFPTASLLASVCTERRCVCPFLRHGQCAMTHDDRRCHFASLSEHFWWNHKMSLRAVQWHCTTEPVHVTCTLLPCVRSCRGRGRMETPRVL